MILASIPSPAESIWYLGPLPIRAYALCLLAGIVVAIVWGDRRWQARGGHPGAIADLAVWAVPFGIIGARLYHVVTTPDPYFGSDGDLLSILYVWEGGLGIWGAVALGGVGAWIGARQAGMRLPVVADCVAPAILVAQALGRWGNWFNQELYGRPTDLPWALEIDQPVGYPDGTTFHPTFLYESLWSLAGVAVLVVVWRRTQIGHGRLFALYIMIYTAGRLWIEALRVDPAEMIGPFRLNVWTSVIVFVGALAYLVIAGRRHPGRETDPYLPGRAPVPAAAAADGTATTDTAPDATPDGSTSDTVGDGSNDPTADPAADPPDDVADDAADDPPAGPGRTGVDDDSTSRPG